MRLTPRSAGPLTLGALAGVSVMSYVRVFSGRAWLVPALLAAWIPVALVVALRRAGLRAWTTGVLASAAGAVFVIVVVEPRLASLGGPPRSVAGALVEAWRALDTTFTPASPSPGLLGLLLCGAWACGVTSALVARSALAPYPWVALFVFAASVGTSRGQHALVVGFLLALLAVLYAQRWGHGIRAAAGSAAVAVVAAVAIPSVAAGYFESGPQLGPLGTESADTTVISPIVQILPRLNDRTPRVLFTVESNRPSYWKLASLDRFDGTTWSTTGEYRPVRDTVGLDDGPQGRFVPLTQAYTIEGLGGVWVPAAYAPTRVSGLRVSVDPVRATLATDGLRRGQRYTVVSETPAPTPDLLRRAGERGAPQADLDLPPDLPPVIGQIAGQVTRGAATAYDRALAIQSFLRTFDYRQDIAPGHSGSYLVHFLTELKAGYCEQFAGSMAVMLRTLGIPARVAVGFLPGTGTGGRFVVGSEEAHAWPEVWFHDVGWVPFEPTPRSGVAPPGYAVAPIAGFTQPGSSSPITPGSSAAPDSPSPRASAAAPETDRPDSPSTGGSGGSPRSLGASALRWALAVAALLGLLTAARAVRLRAWTIRMHDPAQRIRSAWQELLLRGADAWRPRRGAETEQEYARAITGALGIDYTLASPLVAARQQAAYAAGAATDENARAALGAIRALRRRLLRAAGWKARLRLVLSPRPLLVRRRTL